MRTIHLLIAAILVGCSMSTTGASTPTPAAYIEVQSPSPIPTPSPLMDGLPTTFASCAGSAKSVKRAAYNCLRDWEPAAHPPVNVVYHYSRSVASEYKEKTQLAIEFGINRIGSIARLTAPNPNVHVFVIHDGADACKRIAQAWEGTKTFTWMWENTFAICNAEGEGDPRQASGQAVGSALKNTGSAWTRVEPERAEEGVWIVLGEVAHELLALTAEYNAGSSSLYSSLNQRWIFYVVPTMISSAYNIQVRGADLESFNPLGIAAGAATWKPTYTDHNFCPGWVPEIGATPYTNSCSPGPDIGFLSLQLPWNYTLYGRAMDFLVAYFGPEWLLSVYYPLLYDEYEGQDGNFRETHDRIARRIWGGKWSDLEASMDMYLIEELKRGGVTGLD